VDRYTVEFKPAARKELEELTDPVLGRVIRKLESLGSMPRPPGCKKLKGYKDQWRVRIGDWRSIYIIDDESKLVSVTRIAHTARCLRMSVVQSAAHMRHASGRIDYFQSPSIFLNNAICPR
jgi:mRNA interferase RelE/StbE